MKKLLLLSMTFLALLACKSDDNDMGTDDTPPPPDPNTVQLRNNANFGNILTDAEGMTLYFFSLDSKGDSNCVDGCKASWPVFYAEDLTLDDGLEESDFGSITRSDGDMQTTYKGWPLYRYASDNAADDVNGDGVNDVWYVAKPDYSVMMTLAQLVGRDSGGVETNLTSTYEPGDEQTFYMTDANGNTLYSFVNDTNGVNNFTNEDFSNNPVWPIFEEQLQNIPSILDANDFGSIDVFGRTQLTYKGWPIYYFGQDAQRGDNFGVGFPVAGIWPILNPDIEIAPEPEPNAVRLRDNTTFGNILTDAEGMTLYFFSPDSKGDSNCIDGCKTNWPVFYVEDLTLDDGLEESDFGSITRSDGDMQTTYKGWPLYYFINDNAADDVNGDGIGDVWYVAKPDYSVMMTLAQLVGRDSGGVETNLTSTYEPGDEQTFYMTDANGNTLYSFVNDTNGVNNFTNEDFSNNPVWPIFEEQLQNIPSILDASDFGSIDVFGRTQLTYKGWPIYYFGQDAQRGDNFGVGFPEAGIWPILNPDIDVAPQADGATSYDVTNQGATEYIFNGSGLSDASNPDLTLKRGETYEFVVAAPGHPFIIKSVQSIGTGNAYNDGVTNNGAATGTVVFTVPNDAPDTLYYNCEFHSPMTGTLTITD
ncbi:hypothetical protein [Flagellimonas algicola]|uniref:Uncharacterized protein n=1 Tax=Flagellimonas algicola TaxID=2583815 RepID=A0ABY2WJW5_9FLAO|nr:hypothetical protein [Allomuricauda algicola]TMU55134.1 hypothetical protein FGG15_13200 [Allomuricauda algicola]